MNALYYINPVINARRFYSIRVERDLFGESIIVRSWGRIGTNGSTRIDRYGDIGSALACAAKIYKRKIAKGYTETLCR